MKTLVACVILAAGASKRFGDPKQLAEFGNNKKSLLQQAVDSANASRADVVILVLGSDSREILARLTPGRANIVFNPSFQEGLSTSVKAGLESIPREIKGAIFMVADQPFVNCDVLNNLIARFEEQEKESIVALSFRGEARNPILIPRAFFAELSKLHGDVGARQFLRMNPDKVTLLNVEDEKIFLDVDTKSNLLEARKKGKHL